MQNEENYSFHIKEGGVENYLDALEKLFGGTRTNSSYEVHTGGNRMNVSIVKLLPEFEIILFQQFLQKKIYATRLPDDRSDFYHLTLINEGQITRQNPNEQLQAEAGSSMGLFFHNGLFPLNTVHPARIEIRSVSVKFSKEAVCQIIPEADNLLQSLFPDNKPIWYHTHVSSELERMAEDIFFLEKADFGSRALIMSKGLELFTLLLSSLNKQLQKEDLHGLHIDDYKRIMKIKNYLLSKVEEKISMDEIAVEYGISTSKLKRDFNTVFDSSVSKFHTHAKMDEALRRLRSGKYSVTEVGYDLGYQNVSKFSLMFKKVKGINPKEVIPL
ncbi:AraC family transcriptional regulator [Prolixibacteraceae bacterium Z1-6]|uniref:AraC family transcriptional regulator n=1 Tax=Draconibacterium aestuarii TaxID=2998507 RepID=A0A9X3F6Q4_9BACT|nr:AraC family transcriptional regulator [Prolixibacteraceae bacterium Z1-6]